MASTTRGTRLVDRNKFVHAFPPAVPASAAPTLVNLSAYDHLTIILSILNATTVTGSAITVKQSLDNVGTGSKPVPFIKMWANVDTVASDSLVETAVVANTFTTGAVNSKAMNYIIEINASDLDINNNFNWITVGIGNGTATTIAATYILGGARFGGNVSVLPTAIV